MAQPCDRRAFLASCAALAFAPAIARGAAAQDSGAAPYVPTPPEVVEGMLDMAALAPGEQLVDLGSGDGRIPIAAARRGAMALGVEIEPRLVARARSLASFAGLEARARFSRADLFTVSLRDADVVTLYLLPSMNERLKPKLLTEMKPGARVVSHAFDMGDWPPDMARSIADKNVYMWTIPAIAGGEWRLTRADGSSARLIIEQRYGGVAGTLDGIALAGARLKGVVLSFLAEGVPYRGIVGDRSITPDPSAGWRATRPD
jgi:hypothetical protein